MRIEVLGPIAGLIFGALGTWISVRRYVKDLKREWQQKWDEEINRKAESQVKAYAAERDFNHLRGNQEQMRTAVAQLQEELDEVSKVLIEIKTSHNATFHRVENLAARFDSSTSGWGRPQ